MEATAISDPGIVVGNSSVREGGFGPNSHACVYSGGHFIDINGDAGFTLARDVNDFGNVVGAGLWKDQVPALAAGFWVPGAPALKPINQTTAILSEADAVSSQGYVVGSLDGHAMFGLDYFAIGELQVVAGLPESEAFGISDDLQVVGEVSFREGSPTVAVLITSNSFADLNTQIDNDAQGVQLTEAVDISRDSQFIVAHGTQNGTSRCYLLSPPKPRTFQRALPSYTIEKLLQLMRDWPNPGPDPESLEAKVFLASLIYQLSYLFPAEELREPVANEASRILGRLLSSGVGSRGDSR